MKRFIITLSIVLALAVPAWSAKVKVWNPSSPSNFEKAEFQRAVLTNQGVVRLARDLKPFADIEAAHVWAVAEDKNGNLYVATGNEGKVFKVSSDGKTSVVYKGEDSQVLSLAVGPDGGVYAGTGPSGLVIQINAKGESKEFCKTTENYVWSLAFDSKGETLFAGTGPKGRIYQIDKEGKASIHYSTKQEHVLCVATGTDGHLYAGTSKRGLVYRIDAQGKGFVLLETAQSEVRTLLVTKDGIYAGTSAPTARKVPGTAEKPSSDKPDLGISRGKATPLADDDDKIEKSEGKEPAAPTTGGKEPPSAAPSKESTAPMVSSPSSKENSVYRIAYDGIVREVFREKTMILALAQEDDRLLIGTGGDGQIFEVRPFERERTELLRLDHTQIHCMLKRADGSLVLGTGDPGKLYTLRNQFAAKGVIVSEVFDAKLQSKWGSLRWKAETPKETKVSVAVRSGNVSEPDETWSDWSEEQTDGDAAMSKTPPSRFFQYRVTLASDDAKATPAFSNFAVRYAAANIAPDVTAIEVPDLNAVTLDNAKKLKIKWKASDLNDDDLTYAVHFRKEGWKHWVPLADDLEKRECEWDTTTTPSGVYQLKVTASDRQDNSAEEALVGEKTSETFIVDHAAPAVTAKVVGFEDGHAIVEAAATDEWTRLASAAFAVDGKKWTSAFPADGLFDRKTAAFRFKTDAIKPGTHVLVLRVTDAAGNTGSKDVVFELPAK